MGFVFTARHLPLAHPHPATAKLADNLEIAETFSDMGLPENVSADKPKSLPEGVAGPLG